MKRICALVALGLMLAACSPVVVERDGGIGGTGNPEALTYR